MAQRQERGIHVKVAGSSFTLDRALVAEAVRGSLPDPIKDHFVVVDGRRFPPKQVVSLVTGLDRADFTTHQARRILRRLGFAVGRRSTDALPDPPRSEGPHGGRQAEALRPYRGKWVAQKEIEVLVAADTPEEVMEWLERHDVYADLVFRVPERPEEWDLPAVDHS